MSFLRLANIEDTKRVYYEDTEEYIEIRTELTKREANDLLKFAPRKEDDLDGGLRFITKAFNVMVVDWSLVDQNEEKIPATPEFYEKLDAAPAGWIDRTLGGELRAVLGAEAEEAEKKLDELEPEQFKVLASESI